MTINISLPAEMEARVREHVASGLYGSASEVVREALRLFEAYQSVRMSTLVALKADLDKGVADLQAGRVVPMDMASLKAEGRARRSKRAA
jgi:antitoxin ParD1/3/4